MKVRVQLAECRAPHSMMLALKANRRDLLLMKLAAFGDSWAGRRSMVALCLCSI